MTDLTSRLAEFPRFALGHWPTPLHLLPRLSEELGGPRIWVKRDDLTGLATGGNKTRKLEYIIGAARAAGATRIVTFGAVQSNHARQTAASAAAAGIDCTLLLTRQVPSTDPRYEVGGNILLNRLFGAEIELFDVVEQERLKERVAALRAEGAIIVPAGGSNVVGALGYAQAALEITSQLDSQRIDIKSIFHASSSAGTQAGLAAGLALLGSNHRLIGVNVYHDNPETLKQRVTDLCAAVLDELDIGRPDSDIHVNHAYIGPGYGIPDAATLAAIRMAAELEGLVFDPAYSGKALTALIDQISIGNLSRETDVLLIHTGGVQSINVYESELLA